MFPLAVMRCLTHGHRFTLYPPGHVPYGRVRVAPVALDGTELSATLEKFVGSRFDAAIDAADGTAWKRENPGGSDKWWPKQGRRLVEAVQIFGVTPGLDPALQHAQAAALEVDLLLLVQWATLIANAPGYRSRGQAAVAVLEQVVQHGRVLQCVLAAGHRVGLWGPPLRWDTAARQLRPWAFRGDGTHLP